MKKAYWFLLLVSMTIIFWLNVEAAYCQTNANYQIEWAVIDGGGGERSSASYDVLHSIGQPTGSVISLNSKYVNTSGVYAGNMSQGSQFPSNPDDQDPTPSPIPEPATLFLLAAGIVGIFAFARKRRKGGEV